jgi:hypothetical protein
MTCILVFWQGGRISLFEYYVPIVGQIVSTGASNVTTMKKLLINQLSKYTEIII